jgi:hypothetical protein
MNSFFPEMRYRLARGPYNSSSLRDFAFFRATCPDAAFRDGKKAIEMAQRAIQLAGAKATWVYPATLAAAFAESGEFEKAVAEQKKALTDKGLDTEDRARMEARLKLYERKMPYRDE